MPCLTTASEPPTPEQLNQLHITDQVIKETLRIYPPIHVGNRFAMEDLNLQGYKVPAGTRVMDSIYLTHRDKNHWPEPEQFRPERFERSQEQNRPPLAYVPFGGGPRNCIGAAFAQIEAKVVLARLLQCFDFQLLNEHEIHPHMGATLEPRPGVQMRVQLRRPFQVDKDSCAERASYTSEGMKETGTLRVEEGASENERPQLLYRC